MIKNASELLTAFMAAERKEVESIQMDHMPTLGAAYEAIVSSGIDNRFVLPPGLDLRVVSGFIEGLKNQLDCMLVQGEGKRYGKTDQYIYPVERVLCVVEVKKTMSKADLVDGIGHLADVQRRYLQHFVERFNAGEIHDFEQARETYTTVTGRSAPLTARDLDDSSVEVRHLFSTLVRQVHAPVTILLGFDGYATERGLREALVDIVRADIGKESNAVPDLLPSLISAGSLSLVKCNGLPYAALDGEDRWVAIASARHNAALVLLELLWTKIDRFCNVRMPFGPEVDVETLDCVLTAKGVRKGDIEGWAWRSSSKSEAKLASRPAAVPWEPVKLSKGAMSVTNQLALRGGMLELDQGLRNYIQKTYGEDLDQVVAEMVRTSAFRLRGTLLLVIPPVAFVARLPDDTGIAGPRREPLERWCAVQGVDAVFMNLMMLD